MQLITVQNFATADSLATGIWFPYGNAGIDGWLNPYLGPWLNREADRQHNFIAHGDATAFCWLEFPLLHRLQRSLVQYVKTAALVQADPRHGAVGVDPGLHLANPLPLFAQRAERIRRLRAGVGFGLGAGQCDVGGRNFGGWSWGFDGWDEASVHP